MASHQKHRVTTNDSPRPNRLQKDFNGIIQQAIGPSPECSINPVDAATDEVREALIDGAYRQGQGVMLMKLMPLPVLPGCTG